MRDSPIRWTQASVAGVPLRRFVGYVGAIEVGTVEWDGSSGFWTWYSRLADNAWGHAQTEHGAMKAFGAWLRGWLETFRPFFE